LTLFELLPSGARRSHIASYLSSNLFETAIPKTHLRNCQSRDIVFNAPASLIVTSLQMLSVSVTYNLNGLAIALHFPVRAKSP